MVQAMKLFFKNQFFGGEGVASRKMFEPPTPCNASIWAFRVSHQNSPRKRWTQTFGVLILTLTLKEVLSLAGARPLLHGRSRRHGVHVAKKQGYNPGTVYRRVPIDLLQWRSAMPGRLEDGVRPRLAGVLRRCRRQPGGLFSIMLVAPIPYS